MNRLIARSLVALAILASVACSEQKGNGGIPKPSPDDPVSVIVGPRGGGGAGGWHNANDGVFAISIPEGALSQDVTITIRVVPSPLPGNLGRVYQVEPVDLVLARPATVQFKTASSDLDGKLTYQVKCGKILDGAWTPLQYSRADGFDISGRTTHLGVFGVFEPAAGRTCVDAFELECDGGGCSTPPRCSDETAPCSNHPETILSECNEEETGRSVSCCSATP